jgi:mannose-6-phosphate isomerase-like protein (cupin superfamily)
MPTSFASNLDEEFAQVSALWSPRVIAVANGQYVKVARVKGEFVWHSHADEDEFFLVRKGKLVIRYRDRTDATLGEGDFHVVPRGVEHMSEHAITTSIEQQLAHLRAPHQPTRQQETPAQWPSKS